MMVIGRVDNHFLNILWMLRMIEERVIFFAIILEPILFFLRTGLEVDEPDLS